MKKFKSYRFLMLLTIAAVTVLFNSCSTSSIPMDVLVPADVYISHDITNVGIINRSLPTDDNKFANILEGFFTGETIRGDRVGSATCMTGLADKLNQSPRFNAVILQGLDLRGTGTKNFPPPLLWGDVQEYCDRFRVEAIIALETFDSDIRLKQGEREVERKKDGEKIIEIEYWGKLNIGVNAGWKVYDPTNRSIIDADIYSDNKSWDETGSSPENVLSQLPSKREAINDAGHHAGTMYAYRISPTWMHVSRQYYVKGNPELEKTKRYVKTNNWDAAIEIWEKLVEDPDPQIAGRAAYNMALSSEMNGDLDTAIGWAKKSYEEFGNKKALNYMRTLQRRRSDQDILDEQMPQ